MKRKQEEIVHQEKLLKVRGRLQKRKIADQFLIESEIQANALSFKDFSTEIWNENSQLVDLVISDVPFHYDDDIFGTLPSACDKVFNLGVMVCSSHLSATIKSYSLRFSPPD